MASVMKESNDPRLYFYILQNNGDFEINYGIF